MWDISSEEKQQIAREERTRKRWTDILMIFLGVLCFSFLVIIVLIAHFCGVF